MSSTFKIYVSPKNVVLNEQVKKPSDRLPVVVLMILDRIIKTGHDAVVEGPSHVVYRPTDPMKSGARVWIETEGPVVFDGERFTVEGVHRFARENPE